MPKPPSSKRSKPAAPAVIINSPCKLHAKQTGTGTYAKPLVTLPITAKQTATKKATTKQHVDSEPVQDGDDNLAADEEANKDGDNDLATDPGANEDGDNNLAAVQEANEDRDNNLAVDQEADEDREMTHGLDALAATVSEIQSVLIVF
jgi:hypothetical protein